MTVLSRIDCKRAPCGCPAAEESVDRPSRRSAYDHSRCPANQAGYYRQHGTDLLIPLIDQHIWAVETGQLETSDAPLSWQSGATQISAINTEEGYSRYNQGGLNGPVVLTPMHGTNMNESRQFQRAVIEAAALQISPLLHRFMREEDQDDVDIDENGDPYYASPRRRHITISMMPYYQAPTGSMVGAGTLAVHYGNPSSRGHSSSHHSGRRNLTGQSSSAYDNNNYFAGAGGAFEEEPERASQLTMSEDFLLFPFEQDQE